MKKARIVFMGTPDFAVESLKALQVSDHDVALVVTMPDKPKGRGREIAVSPVKKAALKAGYKIAQPTSVNTNEFIQKLKNIEPDLLVVVAFGALLSEEALLIPKKGAINIHGSLLPKYRGPSPIHAAIINREKKTGITSIFMDKGLDTGDILISESVQILPKDTAGSLHDRLAGIGASVLVKTIEQLENIQPISQDHKKATYSKILKKNDGRIDWTMSAQDIETFIRGMTPWPGAFTFNNKKRYKIFAAETIKTDNISGPGSVIGGFKEELIVRAGSGALKILEIQPESGKKMPAANFMRGFKIKNRSVFK